MEEQQAQLDEPCQLWFSNARVDNLAGPDWKTNFGMFVCLFVEFMAGQTLICKLDVWLPSDMSDMLVGFSRFTMVTKLVWWLGNGFTTVDGVVYVSNVVIYGMHA
jgi:hypothetical protein